MAPEHPFPAAYDDAIAAVQWAIDAAAELDIDPTTISVGGDSAGGNLAAAVAQHFGSRIRGQLLVYPAVDLSSESQSALDYAEGFLLNGPTMQWFANQYLGDSDRRDPRVSPLLAADEVIAAVAPAQDCPNRVIRFVVPFPASGLIDTLARVLAAPLSKTLGQNIVIENRTGANTVIGTEQVFRAPADGYTVLFMATSFTVNPFARSRLPYDALKDFTPVTLITATPLILVSPPSFPPKTVQELVDYVKANAGKVNYGSTGDGRAGHLAREKFRSSDRKSTRLNSSH